MNRAGRSDYLESKILTASGPQLHLMLIEGAIRFVRQADSHYAENNEGHATQSLLRAMDIVEELLAGVRHDTAEINARLAQLYEFLFRTMTSCYVNSDRQKLADVLRILDFQRETWKLACEKLAQDAPAEKSPVKRAAIIPTPHMSDIPLSQRVSFEA